MHVNSGWHDLVDAVEHVVAQAYVGPGQQVVELIGAPRADQHRRDCGVRAHERDGQVRERQPRLVCELAELLDRSGLGSYTRLLQVEHSRAHPGIAGGRGGIGATGEPAGVERREREHTHAVALGWDRESIEVIDTDLGISGRSTEGRDVTIRQRLEAEGILFKIRVLGSNVRNQELPAAPASGRTL